MSSKQFDSFFGVLFHFDSFVTNRTLNKSRGGAGFCTAAFEGATRCHKGTCGSGFRVEVKFYGQGRALSFPAVTH